MFSHDLNFEIIVIKNIVINNIIYKHYLVMKLEKNKIFNSIISKIPNLLKNVNFFIVF